jgi:VWFA-related protein
MEMRRFVAVLAIILLVPLAHPQTTPSTTSQNPSIITNVDEVTLDLVVRNKRNSPVLDLKPEDIVVRDGGSAVKLTDLRLVTGQAGADHLVTLFFDQLDPSAATNARDIARKILKVMPASGFSYAVMNVYGRLQLFQEFTTDRTAIEKAINSATSVDSSDKEKSSEAALPEKQIIAEAQTGADPSGVKVSANERSVAQVILAALQESQRIVQDQHAQPALAGLLALARTERKISGRKIVIYFTEGLRSDPNNRDMVRLIAGAANRSGVSIYVINKDALDTRAMQGLTQSAVVGAVRLYNIQNPQPTGPAAQIPVPYGPGMITMENSLIDRLQSDGLDEKRDPLVDLAANTGGAFIASEDNLKKPFQQLVADLTTYYEASYIPANLDFDGQFRPIAVKAVREGLKIRSRPGYFAVPPDTGTVVRPFEAPMMKALAEAQLPAEVKFRSRVLRLGDLPSGDENELVVEVPVSELETRDDVNSNLYSLHVSIMGQVKNKAGAVIEHFSEDVPRHGSLDSKAAAQSDVVTMQRHFTAGPGEYVLEAAVLDRNSGKVSAQRVEFEIPNAASGPSLSDVTLVQRMIPTPPDVDSEEPLRYGSGKVIPDLSGRVAHGTKQISFFFLVHPDADAKEPPTLEMEILKGGETVTQVPLTLRTTNGPVSVPYMASIQSGTLPSGDYSVVERLTQGGKTAEHEVAFRVEGPELAHATEPGGSAESAASNGDAVTASDLPSSDLSSEREEDQKAHRVVITTLPAGTVPAPSADELQAIIANARKRALDYAKTLPNFVCVEVTNRSVDAAGNGKWKHRDSLAELLRYHDNEESRSTLEINGRRSNLQRAEMNTSWPLSVGEFGAMLNLVFQPSSKTEFEYREAATREDRSGTVQVLTYRVLRDNATITLGQGSDQVGVGFHGLVYIDPATGGVQRITMQADGLPKTFSMSAAAMTVDYDYVAIAGRDYLLPVRSTVSLQRHHKAIELNEITFQNYRRFASRSKIKLLQ